MPRPEDDFTSTVDGAAAFERHHSDYDVIGDDRQAEADALNAEAHEDEPEYEPEGHRPGCHARDFSECVC